MNNIRISVVTVSFNAEACIEKTMLSVIGQDYGNLEYIVIDGGSTDRTAEIIRSHQDRLSYWCSEKDGGIYFGMNKGIDAATGEYILFMNADDVFVDSHVISDVVAFIETHPDADVIYGDSEQIHEYGTYTIRPACANLRHTMSISHQATFARASLLKEHPFDTRYRYAADYEQLSSLYLENKNFVYFERTVARVEMRGGTTFRHFLDSADELFSIIGSRGEDITDAKKKMIRHKKIVRAFRACVPSFITRPVFRIIAKYYKAL